MERIDELKEKLNKYIQSNSEFSYEEKETWLNIISELADYQESTLQKISSFRHEQTGKEICVHCGITSRNKNLLGKNFRFMSSVADDIKAADFPDGNIISDKNLKKDGEWFVIGTGYLDCDYEKVNELCGRSRSYQGKSSSGEFSYSLVLKNVLLHQEKILYDIAGYYNIDGGLIYAPMLRRLVYIETRSEIECNLSECDLQLEKNGLSCLLGGWRAVWNVEISDSPFAMKSNGKYMYCVSSEEYVIPLNEIKDQLFITGHYDSDSEKEYMVISSEKLGDPKKFMIKVCIPKMESLKDISSNDIMIYTTPEMKVRNISEIYSKSDVMSFLWGYSDFIKCLDVYSEYMENFKVCSYEYGYEYLSEPEYFCFSGRPTLYVSFENNGEKFFFDRVVYIIHVLQRRFPEYIWKGGYFQ